MPDLTLVCVDCKKEFLFEEGEQKFFAEKNFITPKRCRGCRFSRRVKRDQEEANHEFLSDGNKL